MENFLKIQITPAKNGIKVLVGCHEFVYQQNQLESFMSDLHMYLKDPEEARKLVFKRWGIKEEVSPDQPDAPAIRHRVEMAGDNVKEQLEDREVETPGPTRERSR